MYTPRMRHSSMFQSLLGFLIRCNLRVLLSVLLATTQMFQSLLGFLIRCNEISRDTSARHATMFQSLLGFLIRCNSW